MNHDGHKHLEQATSAQLNENVVWFIADVIIINVFYFDSLFNLAEVVIQF